MCPAGVSGSWVSSCREKRLPYSPFLLSSLPISTQGGAKVQEAAYIYDELIDKYGSSPVLLNGLAVSKMHLAQWEEAETALKEAITKVRNDVL